MREKEQGKQAEPLGGCLEEADVEEGKERLAFALEAGDHTRGRKGVVGWGQGGAQRTMRKSCMLPGGI